MIYRYKEGFMRQLFPLSLLLLCFSCKEKHTSSNTMSYTANAPATTAEERTFDVPVLYKNWELGSHKDTRVVLKMYKAWDGKSIAEMNTLLADTVTLDLPHGKRQAAPRDKMIAWLMKTRKDYLSTSNDIIAAFPLHNKDRNEEWVSVLVYNKWTNKDRSRDSMLYQDLWKVKDGQINYLLTLEQTPSRPGVKRLDEMVSKD